MTILAQAKKTDGKLRVVIRDRGGTLYEGTVDSVSSVNDRGPFNVLALHANFISIIKKSISLRLRGNIVEEFSIETGILVVRGNTVEIYLGVLQ